MQVGFRFEGIKLKKLISDNIYFFFFSENLEESSAENEGNARQLKVYGQSKIFKIKLCRREENDD